MANTHIHDVPCATMMSLDLNISPNTYPKFTHNPLKFHPTSTQILIQTKLEVIEAFLMFIVLEVHLSTPIYFIVDFIPNPWLLSCKYHNWMKNYNHYDIQGSCRKPFRSQLTNVLKII
jgi:hypothetical protein